MRITARTRCRACGSPLPAAQAAGRLPLPRAYLSRTGRSPGPVYRLSIAMCATCRLVHQLGGGIPGRSVCASVDRTTYRSRGRLGDATDDALEILERFRRRHRGMAVGLGSSDGYRLLPYADAGWRTLGVEPAGARTALAQLSGLHAIPMPFTPDLARRLIRSGLRADVVLTGDLLARAEAPGSILDSLRGMLASGGRVVVRVPIVDERLVTVVDPEYRSYFSPTAVLCLLSRHGYSVESQRIAIGAVGLEARLVVRAASSPSPGFAPLAPAAVEELSTLQNRERVIYPLRQAIRSAHSEGRRIATLGAGRATSNLLNLVGAQPSDVTFATDVNPAKIGLRLPGSNVPIASVNALFQPRAPEVVVIADPRVSRESRPVQKDLRDHGRLVLDLCDPQPAPPPVSRLAST